MKLSYQKMQVLLVEGTKMALDTLQQHLEPFNFYRVWTATGVDEAMLLLKDKHVDLIITAWKIQPISGLQMVEMVRRRPELAEVPLVLIAERRDKAMEKTGLSAGASVVLGHPLTAKEVGDAVVKLLESNIDENEEQFLNQMRLARQAERRNNSAKAEAAYRKALEFKPTETQASMALGRILRLKGDIDGAQAQFFAVLRADPNTLKAYLELAMVYRQQSRLPEALRVLEAALKAAVRLKESGVTKAGLYYQMGEVELQIEHLQKAIANFRKAAEQMPDDPGINTQVGDALLSRGHYAESEEFYERALELDPSQAHVYNRLAIAHRKQGNLDTAINLYRKALTYHPRDEHLLYNMGRCFWEMGEYQRASEMLTQALDINPDLLEAQLLLNTVLAKMGFQVNEEGTTPEPPPED